jgi:hypothetical protein
LNPPLVALRLLQSFTSEAVAGDLIETYRSGMRSRLWFWRQVVGSVAAQMSGDFREQPFPTMRAIVLGLLFTWVIARYAMWYFLNYDEWLFSRGLMRWIYLNGYGLPTWFGWPISAVLFAASGWIVVRTNRQLRPTVALTYGLCTECVWLGIGLWGLTHSPIPRHLIDDAIRIGGVSSFACLFAFIGGIAAVHSESQPAARP